MKRLLFITCLFMISCKDSVTISAEEYKKLKGNRVFEVADRQYVITTGSDGHDYYEVYIATGGYHGEKRDFHYPDCLKCINKDSTKNVQLNLR